MTGMRYQCKIMEVGNQTVQGRIGQQCGQLRHHSLRYLPRVVFCLDRVEYFTRVVLKS